AVSRGLAAELLPAVRRGGQRGEERRRRSRRAEVPRPRPSRDRDRRRPKADRGAAGGDKGCADRRPGFERGSDEAVAAGGGRRAAGGGRRAAKSALLQPAPLAS